MRFYALLLPPASPALPAKRRGLTLYSLTLSMSKGLSTPKGRPRLRLSAGRGRCASVG